MVNRSHYLILTSCGGNHGTAVRVLMAGGSQSGGQW